uniref:F-box protein 43 n=1 Tax=Pavo cristatus TaxID=9049 RepID=A0A8C9F104_PAVCR
MSDSHSVTFSIIKRNRLMSPSSSFKCSSFKDTRSTSVFLDSRCNESFKDPDAEHKETPRATSLSLREANRSTYFFETPKAGRKGSSLRRRLLLSKAGAAVGSCEKQASSSGSSRKKLFSPVLSSDEKLSQTASDSLKDGSCNTLRSSTAETEGSSPDCSKRRLSFSQQRTSTLDESKCKDPSLLETECFSPIEGKDVTASNTNEFSESVLMSVGEGLLQTPTYSVLPEVNDSKILTSIDSLVENFNFELCDGNNPSVKLASYPNISTPEDSGYNSLQLDKSGDSLSDHEGSFQESFRKRKEGSKILDIKKKARKIERVRRLSTLQEQGSQSETEDHHGSPNSARMLAEERSFVTEDHGLVLKKQTNKDSAVNYGDLSRTPALQVVHEICLRRQRSDKNQISKNTDGTQMVALEHVLAGLIGKKMGLEKLDILTELKYRNLKHVLAILCMLGARNWHRGIKVTLHMLPAGLKEGCDDTEDAATRLNVLNRSALRPVQAQARTPVLQTPPSYAELTPRRCNSVPQSTSRHEEYLKVAKTLFSDEALKPCPRCQYPAKYQLVKKWGLCSREACAFEFCILCLHAFHGSKECNSLSAKQKNKKDAPPGSAQSKRNLKRL